MSKSQTGKPIGNEFYASGFRAHTADKKCRIVTNDTGSIFGVPWEPGQTLARGEAVRPPSCGGLYMRIGYRMSSEEMHFSGMKCAFSFAQMALQNALIHLIYIGSWKKVFRSP